MLCLTLPNTARTWPALHEPARSSLTRPILPWSTQPGSTLSCLALHSLKLPSPTLSGSADHARSCPAMFGTDRPYWPSPVLFGPVRHYPTLPDPAQTCLHCLHICTFTSLQCLATSCQPCPTLVWPCPVCANYFNPRPDTVFRHLRSDKGVRSPLGVSKRSIVELSGKDQQIALAEYSRLVVLLLVLDQHLTQLWQVKSQIFGNSMIFFNFTSPYQQHYLS